MKDKLIEQLNYNRENLYWVPKLTRWQRLKLRLGQKIYVGHRKGKGWTGKLPFYAFICPYCHRVAVDYPSGYDSALYCIPCLKKLEKILDD